MKTLVDLTAPAPVTRKLLEKDVQKQCVDWARARGYWARKFSSQSQRSVPDYLFAKEIMTSKGEDILKFFVEFKAPGKDATEAQLEEQELMVLAGWDGMAQCDDLIKFIDWVTAYTTGSLPYGLLYDKRSNK